VLDGASRAEAVKALLDSCSIAAKTAQRGEKHVVYLKLGEHITALMALTGAHATLLDYENVRAMKDLRNNVNRVVNCESANLGKLSNAVARQRMCIDKLMRDDRFRLLNDDLQATAYARLDHPEATLRELADILGISKSGVSHRLSRIEAMANDVAE
ncbi:MAG: DNA-binding protein WhiA, partial [Eubacteriales bacterium]|nr:DNA-binding protein WhiA [Eubacteriales bacterium]